MDRTSTFCFFFLIETFFHLEAAKREALEETGLDVEVGQLTGIYYDPTYDMHHFVFISNNKYNKNLSRVHLKS
ncbi:NUDIX domain-containing protein [Paenibacillus harenae]|uniref:NUDIX hydrolase n=1 Tax=Paenibacillus harenae TaxID=306543 RepID=UPI001469A113